LPNKITDAVKAMARVIEAISVWLLFGGGRSSSLMPVPQFNPFEKLDCPIMPLSEESEVRRRSRHGSCSKTTARVSCVTHSLPIATKASRRARISFLDRWCGHPNHSAKGLTIVAHKSGPALQQAKKACASSLDVGPEQDAPVGILNGFGRTLGDGIIGLQALSVALRIHAIPPRVTLFRLPGLPIMVQAIYAVAEFARRKTLPWEFAGKDRQIDPNGSVARVIDMRDFAFDPDFQQTSMIDFFLRRLGVAPNSISTSRKRNTWLAPRVAQARPLYPPGYILVCPNSSMRLRRMPAAIHARILSEALVAGPVVTQGQVPDGLIGRATHAALYENFEELCGLVRYARLVISTDTAMVHLADAFDVPCLAFFPTHHPEWRVRDYPKCRAVMLRSALPPGIEFTREPHDDELAHAAWFPNGADLGWLAEVLTATFGRICARAA
jgi:Glycosyltransferase family 9 (heptosyltransferase)